MLTREGLDAAMRDFVSVMAPDYAARIRAEGRAEGKREALAEIICNRLRVRFGTLHQNVRAAIMAAPQEQLGAWLETVMFAYRLGAVSKCRPVD